MTCPDCGERVVEGTAACDSAKERRVVLYTRRANGNLVMRADGVMVSRETHLNAGASGRRIDRVTVTPGPRFVLHSTVCLGDEALTNWNDRARFNPEVLA